MRLDDLAVRLVAVEAKLASLTGIIANGDAPTNYDDLDARLSVVETTVDHLIAEKTQEHIDAIVSADAGTVAVEAIVALSPSAYVPEAAAIVADVIAEQQSNDAVTDTQVADIIAAAVSAVITAEPEVVTDPVAIIQAITDAVAEVSAPAPEVAQMAADAVADIIATVTGVEAVSDEVHASIVEAVAVQADPALDNIEHRLDAVEAKVDGLLGK